VAIFKIKQKSVQEIIAPLPDMIAELQELNARKIAEANEKEISASALTAAAKSDRAEAKEAAVAADKLDDLAIDLQEAA
jgi:hypothetical protein